MTCPICKKPGSSKYPPFCSRRCADVDLGKWLTGSYIAQSQYEGEEPVIIDAATERVEKPH